MKVTEMRVSVAKTINLGNYSSIRLEAGATAAVEEGDDLRAVRDELHTEIKSALSEQWERFRMIEG